LPEKVTLFPFGSVDDPVSSSPLMIQENSTEPCPDAYEPVSLFPVSEKAREIDLPDWISPVPV